MAERSSDLYVGFLVPFQADSSDIWTAESSYLQDGSAPGDLTPASRSRLRLAVSGTQGTGSLVLTTRRGGHIAPGGAGFTWRNSTDASTLERGWDPPVVVTGYRPIAWTATSVASRRHPDRVVLPDGSVLVCASVKTTTTHDVSVWRITDGAITSTVDVYTQSAQPTAQLDAHLSPSVALLDDGTIILGHLIEDDTAEEAQWRVHRSVDSGATWATISTSALPAPINVDNATGGAGFFINRCRMRHNRGYTMLLVEMVASNTSLSSRHAYRQYASTSDGTAFDLVEEMSHAEFAASAAPPLTSFGRCDVTTHDGGFVVCSLHGDDEIRTTRIADAYDVISGGEQFDHEPSETVGVLASNAYSDGDTSVWSAPDGSLYLAWRSVTGTSECRIARSVALVGASTSYSTLGEGTGTGGSGASWWKPPGLGTYPAEFVGVAALGRTSIFAIAEAATTTTYEGSLFEIALGGWSNVNMPGLDLLAPETRRAGWTSTGLPLELPANMGWTKTGISTEGLATGILQADVSGATGYYSIVPTATVGTALICEFALTMNSGTALTSGMTSGIRVAVEGSITGYETQVRFSHGPDVIAVYDGISGAQLGSNIGVDWDNVYEVRIEQKGTACQAWYRQRDNASDRDWIEITSTSSLTSSGGGGANLIRWGPGHLSTTSQSDWYMWNFVAGDENARQAVPVVNPDTLFARDYAGLGRAVFVEGVLVTATGGPGRENESITLAPKYDDQRGAVDNALYTTATPRRTWRTPPTSPITANIAEQTIAFQTGPGSKESYALSEIIGLHVARATFCTGAIQRKDSSSGWVSVVTFDLCDETAFTGTTYGRTVRPTSGATGRWVDRDELRGGWLRIGASAPYTWRKIAANTPGVLAAPASGLAVVIEFEDADGTEAVGPVAMAVIPPDVTILAHTAGETAEGWRVKIDAQNAALGAAEAGALWLGYVVVPGLRWELGSRTALVPGTVRDAGPDRVSYARELAPDRREMEIGWTATNVSAPLQGAAVAPNHALASALSGARPVAAVDAAAGDVVGLVRRLRGGLIPVVVLPRVTKLTGSADQQMIWRRDEQLRAHFDGPVSVRHVTGDEGSPSDGLAYRVESVPLVELI